MSGRVVGVGGDTCLCTSSMAEEDSLSQDDETPVCVKLVSSCLEWQDVHGLDYRSAFLC